MILVYLPLWRGVDCPEPPRKGLLVSAGTTHRHEGVQPCLGSGYAIFIKCSPVVVCGSQPLSGATLEFVLCPQLVLLPEPQATAQDEMLLHAHYHMGVRC
jgi:hypothetical protein